MELIIDIPEETFKYYVTLANKGEQIGNLERIVLDGTPLPKYLNKIKNEIDLKQYSFMAISSYDEGIRFGLMMAYQIIDNHLEGSENE